MSRLKRNVGIVILIIVAAIISIYALLPQLPGFVITSALKNAGLQVEEITVAKVAYNHVEIPHARFTNSSGTAFDLKQLSINYTLARIISGQAESVSAKQVDIYLGSAKSDPLDALSRLQPLLENDLSTFVPLASAKIDALQLHDAQGKSLLQALATLRRDNGSLQANMDMQLPNGETGHLHIIQQQPGQWLLQMVDPNGSKLVDASFRQAREFPLDVAVNAGFQQLQPWSLLFGFPLPQHQGSIQTSLDLKPDYARKTFRFKLDARLQAIQEPQMSLRSATAVMSGDAAINEKDGIKLTTSPEISLTGFQRGNLSIGSLNTGFDMQVLITKDAIQGSFAPGLEIETQNLNATNLHIGNAALEAVNEQSFSWQAGSGAWQFGDNSLRIKKANLQIGNTTIADGDFDLTHTAWRYPSNGTTNFTLNGTALNAQPGRLELAGNTLKSSGNISWPTTQRPASVSGDIQLAARQLKLDSLSAENALLSGKIQLIFDQNTLQTSFGKASSLTADKTILGTTQIDSPQISLFQPLKIRWDSIDKSLDFAPNRLEFSHRGLVAKQVTISPGAAIFSVDNWNSIKRPRLTGTFTSGHIEVKTSGQHFGLHDTSATYTIDGPLFTLKGASTFLLSDSRVHFDLSHNVMSGRGSATYRSAAQKIPAVTNALKKNIPEWPDELHLQSGTTSVSGEVKWQKTALSAIATLQLDKVNGNFGDTAFSGLDSKIDVDLLPALKGKSRLFRVQSIAVGTTRPPATSMFNAWDDVITPEVVKFVLGSSQPAKASSKQPYRLENTEAILTVDWPRFTLHGASTLQLTSSHFGFGLSHDVASGRGTATYRSDPQPVAVAANALKQNTPDWPRELHLLNGTTSVSGKANWRAGAVAAAATLDLNNVGGNYGEAFFSGLDSSINLDLLPALSGQSRFFRIKLIDIGVPVSQFSAILQIKKADAGRKPVVTLRNASARLLGGSVSGNLIRLDLNRKYNDFALAFKSVDIAELVKLHQFEGLTAIGKLSGAIPIRLGPDGISISDGKASADTPGGSISYIPGDGGKTLKSASAETGLMLDVLRNFQYNQMDATGQYKPDGQLQVRLEIKGKSPNYDKNRPVNLNLNLDQNILSLLKSVRAINGLNERLDKAVREYYESRQR